MRRTVLFLASSTGGKAHAKALATSLSSDRVGFLPWWEAFVPGRTLLSELENIKKRVHGALLIITPDIPAIVRAKNVELTNQNVLFEFGYFYGAMSREQVALVKYGEPYLPSDLSGYIHIHGNQTFRRSSPPRISPSTRQDFLRWLESPEFRRHQRRTVATVAALPPARAVVDRPPGAASSTQKSLRSLVQRLA